MDEAFIKWLNEGSHWLSSEVYDPDEQLHHVAKTAFLAGYKASENKEDK